MSDVVMRGVALRKVYRSGSKEVRAVDGVTIDIARGRSLAIVGPSGAGKSTLLHMLGGLDEPTAGNVQIDGVDTYRLSDKERAMIRNAKVGLVFQFYHLLPEFTALENVMMPALVSVKMSGCQSVKEKRKKAQELLESVGLGERANHRPGELSGGEAQRVAIARALVNGPEILLCDEPTGNLDSKTSEAIYDLLGKLKHERKMTLVIVTHDPTIAARVDETVHMKDGKFGE